MQTGWLWRGVDQEGIESFITRDQWNTHVAKRVEIADALDLTIRAMTKPESVEPDQNRRDEASRHFRLLTVSAAGIRPSYNLRVSVKYVRQSDGAWFKFYQSCWFQRAK
jgi:hypothetical protein